MGLGVFRSVHGFLKGCLELADFLLQGVGLRCQIGALGPEFVPSSGTLLGLRKLANEIIPGRGGPRRLCLVLLLGGKLVGHGVVQFVLKILEILLPGGPGLQVVFQIRDRAIGNAQLIFQPGAFADPACAFQVGGARLLGLQGILGLGKLFGEFRNSPSKRAFGLGSTRGRSMVRHLGSTATAGRDNRDTWPSPLDGSGCRRSQGILIGGSTGA